MLIQDFIGLYESIFKDKEYLLEMCLGRYGQSPNLIISRDSDIDFLILFGKMGIFKREYIEEGL